MRTFIILLSALSFLLGCKEEIQTINGYAQGTTYSVKFWSDNHYDIDKIKQHIDNELARIDKVMSNYRDDSLIEQFNHKKIANIPLALDTEILKVLAISAEVHQKSLGCYDPTIGPLFSIWGFKEDKLHIPSQSEINDKLQAIGFANKLTIDDKTVTKHNAETTVGLSAIGQGYAVARISELLEKAGIHHYLTEIGGEMLVAGTKPKGEKWRVGVERPLPNSQAINEVITLTGKRPTAIMTSGTYRHYFDNNGKKYSHILDPRSGRPVEHNSVAVTVLLDDATKADAWSTALLCLGSESGLTVANQEGIPAIYYDLTSDNQLVRKTSKAVAQSSVYWQTE